MRECTWLLGTLLDDVDILVIRIDGKGNVLPAMIIFFDAKHGQSEQLKLAEKERMPRTVKVEYTQQRDQQAVSEMCFTGPDVKRCVLLPFGEKDIRRQDSVVQLLGVYNLRDDADTENKKWCSCGGFEKDNMILCDAANCETGWYHKRCADLSEDFEADHWLCRACESRHHVERSKYKNESFGDDALYESDRRIQCARKLDQVWAKHKWPERDTLRLLLAQ